MPLTPFTRAARATLATAALAVLAACATVAPAKPEDAVRDRAAQRWQLMRADKFQDAYALVAPSYRALRDFTAWRQNYGPAAGFVDSKVEKVTCDSETRCRATVVVTIPNVTPIRTSPTLSTALEEAWVLEDGRWYFLQPI